MHTAEGEFPSTEKKKGSISKRRCFSNMIVYPLLDKWLVTFLCRV